MQSQIESGAPGCVSEGRGGSVPWLWRYSIQYASADRIKVQAERQANAPTSVDDMRAQAHTRVAREHHFLRSAPLTTTVASALSTPSIPNNADSSDMPMVNGHSGAEQDPRR